MVLFVRHAAPSRQPDPSARVIPAADYAVWQEATAVIEAAETEAAAIRTAARDAHEQERQRGYAEGLEAARLEAAEQMIANVGSTIDYYEKVEGRMVDLVLQAMRRIVADYDDRQRVTTVVRNALAAVRNQKQVTLRIAPDKVDLLKQSTDELLASFPGIGYVDIVADGRLNGDACIVETEIGIVEASMEGQVAALGRAFTKILGSRR
ncbi:HrpE/YscL family type III secretion apparatus protein [Peristeroidobacter soli]|uniref:HrpE/YscL family type III secretion apparatus protein n=1 Tax=Peristeroidobacter soli TaxID=2497877 RepID=UPI00101E1875|nr:HrpE/YscL family type III secretion apparatus protein [Peristeroidobacter soli]